MQTPRHTLQDEDENTEPPLIPQVKSNFTIPKPVEEVFVLPKSVAVILECVAKETVGSVTVTYPQLELERESPEEFDEDEQLYTAVNKEALQRKYQSADIPVYQFGKNGSILGVVVPHFVNSIAEKLVAKEIALWATGSAMWFAVAPCQLNNGHSLCKLDLNKDVFPAVPQLQPPHFITGIGAAVISALAKDDKLANASALVLNAEGQPGFEKVDADSIMDAAEALGRYLVGKATKDGYLKKLSQTVRKINSTATSGMYV